MHSGPSSVSKSQGPRSRGGPGEGGWQEPSGTRTELALGLGQERVHASRVPRGVKPGGVLQGRQESRGGGGGTGP